MALIDPLLRALGWDPEDPALVTPEYSLGAGWADYALLGAEGKPAAVIEAKKLGESLSNQSHLGQMLNYANISGIRYAGLTDGDHWELYTVFEARPLDERCLLKVSITRGTAHEVALQLLLLWRPNMASGKPIEANVPGLGPAPVVPTVVPLPPQGWVALTALGDPTNKPPPSAIRFPDGQETSVRYWVSLLIESARWADGKGLLGPPGSPILSGSRRYILNHPGGSKRHILNHSGDGFRTAVRLSQSGMYLGTWCSAKQVVSDASILLEACHQDPAHVYVLPKS